MSREKRTRRRQPDPLRSIPIEDRLCVDVGNPAMKLAARARDMTVTALVRAVLNNWLQTQAPRNDLGGDNRPGSDAGLAAQHDGAVVRVTLSMPARLAERLEREAYAAEISRGMYVGRLIEAVPIPPDLRENRLALLRSSADLAALYSDLNALSRLLQSNVTFDAIRCKSTVARLSEAVHVHLALAAPLLASLDPTARRASDEKA